MQKTAPEKNSTISVSEVFGANVFSPDVMQQLLPKDIYRKMMRTMEKGEALDPSIADVVANAMKDWAVSKGATHYCHWFQPMTGLTAAKHDSFISPDPRGSVLMEFSGKELIQGEPDASSFPSGGLRATFEARGYTVWDCTSPVFVKEDGKNITMFIPSAFCSYNAEALDKKTPLLRSMDTLNDQAIRVLRCLGNTTTNKVRATLGCEQEYFLVDKSFLDKRLDLLVCGRTLFGAPSPKGQQMDDHYFGTIHERVASFMNELNTELWKLGVSAKTQHNEVSPAQYELAPVFATLNVATDHNHLTMETMQKVAVRHGFACLLHEKPFAGVNGSGKHNNWSLVTDDGTNILDPGQSPHESEVFLVFLAAIIRAVDEYAELLRASVATAGNDHRLGANEAPPAIVSIFLGDQLTDIVEQLEKGGAKTSKRSIDIKLGASTLPPLPKDVTDRNRTSPFAFTGNKFEFRMPGSSMSVAGPNFVLNTIVADVLKEVADELEKSKEVNTAAQKLVQRFIKEHKRVIFNGDNYTDEWVKEAEKRGLPNIRNAVDALDAARKKVYSDLFRRHKVLSKGELSARLDVMSEQYSQFVTIEGHAMVNIGSREILPAAMAYAGSLAESVVAIEEAGSDPSALKGLLDEVTKLVGELRNGIAELSVRLEKVEDIENSHKQAVLVRDSVLPAMDVVRAAADALEMKVDRAMWPLPSYAEMLFVR